MRSIASLLASTRFRDSTLSRSMATLGTVLFVLFAGVRLGGQIFTTFPHNEVDHDPGAWTTAVSPATCKEGTTSAPTSDLPSDTYVKLNASIHGDAADIVGGTCDVYILGNYYDTETRWMDRLTMVTTDPLSGTGGSTAYGFDHRQSFDTRVPTTANGFGDPYLWYEGTYHFDFQGHSVATGCNFPLDSAVVTKTVNALACEPIWYLDGNSHYAHLSPQKIYIYLPSTMSGASSALEDAITAWNDLLSGTGVEFESTTSSCGSGVDCVSVGVDEELLACGRIPSFTTNATTGVRTSGLQIYLALSWTSFTAEGLRRTFVHEMGHLLGLNDSDNNHCGVSEAAMQDQFDCAVESVMHEPKPSDYLPIQKTIYGSGPRRVCGF